MTLGEGVQQFQVFVVFVVLGFALCAVYLFAMGLFRSRLAIILFDAIFGSVSIYAVFATNLAVNNGEFRLFIFIGLALGCVLSVVSCKTLLDKASSALYNLFTTREDVPNDTNVSQQKDIGINSSGNSVGAASNLHAISDAVAMDVSKTTRGTSQGANTRASRQRSRTKRSSGLYEKRRVRKTLGRKQRTDVARRHSLDGRTSRQ